MSTQRPARTRSRIGVVVSMLALMALTACATDSSAVPAAPPTAASTTPPPATPTPEPLTDAERLADLPLEPRVLIVGDSFTAGYGASGPAATWAALAAESLQWRATIDGVGGTGFTKYTATDGRAGLDYRRRLAMHAAAGEQYDLVVLQGGLNDWQASLSAEVTNVRATVAQARRSWPDAPVIVFGPSSPPASVTAQRYAAAIASTAQAEGAIVVDPTGSRPWINAANAARFDLGDGLHLNDAGYLFLAARFAAEIDALLD
jgi:lysophospholipase L1-like esterase